MKTSEINPEDFYVSTILFLRMPVERFGEYQNLIQQKDPTAIEDFVEKNENEEHTRWRVYENYAIDFEHYYRLKTYSMSGSFLLLAMAFHHHKEKLPPKRLSLLEESQLSIFQTLGKVHQQKESLDSPSFVFTGQSPPFKYNDYSGLNHLDHNNIIRLVDFFANSKISDKAVLLETLAHTITYRPYRQFLKQYQTIEGPHQTLQDLEGAIWTIDDEDWPEFQRNHWEFEELHHKLVQLELFLQNCTRFKKNWILLKQFVE